MDTAKAVDSIAIRIKHAYPASVFHVIFTAEDKRTQFDGKKIEAIIIDRNVTQYRMDIELRALYLASQAKTGSGKFIKRKSYTQGRKPHAEIAENMNRVMNDLDTLVANIKQGKYKTKENLVTELIELAKKNESPEVNDSYYRSEAYYGNIDTLFLYMAGKITNDEYLVTLPVNSDIRKYNVVEKEGRKGIADENGKLIVPFEYEYLLDINPYLYHAYDDDSGEEAFLHLNSQTFRLDTLPYIYVQSLASDLVVVEKEGLLCR